MQLRRPPPPTTRDWNFYGAKLLLRHNDKQGNEHQQLIKFTLILFSITKFILKSHWVFWANVIFQIKQLFDFQTVNDFKPVPVQNIFDFRLELAQSGTIIQIGAIVILVKLEVKVGKNILTSMPKLSIFSHYSFKIIL